MAPIAVKPDMYLQRLNIVITDMSLLHCHVLLLHPIPPLICIALPTQVDGSHVTI